MSGEDTSLGEIRKALAGTRRLDALADTVGGAAASIPPGALLDEPPRARLEKPLGLDTLQVTVARLIERASARRG